jgi:hypothetical protein
MSSHKELHNQVSMMIYRLSLHSGSYLNMTSLSYIA